MRILVTGGAGFIGSALVDRLLAEDNQVDVIDDLSSGSIGNLADARAHGDGKLSIHRVDIRDASLAELFEKCAPTIVYHLAAQPSVAASIVDPINDASINVVGSLNVLEAARRSNVQKVVFANTAGLYGEVPAKGLPVREDAPHEPQNPYAAAKRSALEYLGMYRRVHALEFTSLTFTNVYGPRQNALGEGGVVSVFADRALKGEPLEIHGDGSQTRDFVFVDDVVDALARSAERGGGLNINVATSIETSIADLAELVCAQAGSSAGTKHLGRRTGDVDRSSLDPGRAEIILGWKPFTTLPDGIAATLASMRFNQR